MSALTEALAAVQKKDRARLRKELIPALAYTAARGDVRAVAYIAKQIRALAKAAA
jgi:hypothetical protein